MKTSVSKNAVHELELQRETEKMPPACPECEKQCGYQVNLAFDTLLIFRCANCRALLGSVDQNFALL